MTIAASCPVKRDACSLDGAHERASDFKNTLGAWGSVREN
jgi:hypothetical protein